MKVVLETARLRLRQFVPEDAERLFALDSDPEVMRYINGGKSTALATIRDQTLPAFLDFYRRFPHYGFWAADVSEMGASHGDAVPPAPRATGEFIGWFHFRPHREEPGEIDLGYRLVRRYWRRKGRGAWSHRVLAGGV